MAPLLERGDSRLPIDDAADLRNLIGLTPVGTQLDIGLYRDGRRRSLTASVGAAVAERR